jgi:glutamyl-tRNA synthetase
MVEGISPFDEVTAEAELRKTAGAMELKAGDLIHPLRVALTGSKTGPGIFEALVLVGREEAADRIRAAARLAGAAGTNPLASPPPS